MSVHYRGIDNIDEKEPDEIKAKEDFWRIRETLVEEYRSIGILSVFLAGVQAQCLGLADSTEIPRDRDVQAINTLFIGGLLLSLFGALSSSNLARWIGNQTEIEALGLFRNTHIGELLPNDSVERQGFQFFLATAISAVPVLMVAFSFFSFLAGIVVYTWKFQTSVTAITSTAITCVGVVAVYCMNFGLGYVSRAARAKRDT